MTRPYLRSSVAAGYPNSKGDGLEKRLLQAAEQGDACAQCNIGILYGNGVDDNNYAIKGNRPEAVKWLLAAAEQGLPRAQIKLAELYADGPDISGNHATACGWFLLAATGLHGIHLYQARSGYERIASHLSPAEIAKARCFARDWAPKSPGSANPGSAQ
jgi:TPR repeat protein